MKESKILSAKDILRSGPGKGEAVVLEIELNPDTQKLAPARRAHLVTVKCPHCGQPHYHGIPDGSIIERNGDLGHRLSHCINMETGSYQIIWRAPTWKQIVNVEPRLEELYQEAKAVDGGAPYFCANRVWGQVNGLRARLISLVGWVAEIGVLRFSAAYDIAYRKVYDVLPACRHKGLC